MKTLLAQSKGELLDKELRSRGIDPVITFDHRTLRWTVSPEKSWSHHFQICDSELDRMVIHERPDPLTVMACLSAGHRAPDEGVYLSHEGHRFMDRLAERLKRGN